MKHSGIPLGSLETEIVRYVSANPGQTGRHIAEALAEERGVARTTVLTVLERLRAKDLLTRRKRSGVYCYQPAVPAGQAMRRSVERFVDQILGGSISPVLAFLADADELTDRDIDELEEFVRHQKERRRK